jgi:hypothetical protein
VLPGLFAPARSPVERAKSEADGSGSLNVTFAPAGQFTADFVILDAGEFHFIVSDPTATTVASGVAKTQEPGH